MTRLEDLTTIFKAFLQDTLISADITIQLNEEGSCRPKVIEIDLGDEDDKAHVGALLQSILIGEISSVEDTLVQGRNIIGDPLQPEAMYYEVRVHQCANDTYNHYNVKASSVDDALQIAFCLDGGSDGNDQRSPGHLLELAKMHAEVVK